MKLFLIVFLLFLISCAQTEVQVVHDNVEYPPCDFELIKKSEFIRVRRGKTVQYFHKLSTFVCVGPEQEGK